MLGTKNKNLEPMNSNCMEKTHWNILQNIIRQKLWIFVCQKREVSQINNILIKDYELKMEIKIYIHIYVHIGLVLCNTA